MAYSYLLKHKSTGRLYYGIRYKDGMNGDELWKTYFSSSKAVKKLVEEEGPEAFEYQVRVKNKDKEYILKLESKVLGKFNVTKSDMWFNKARNGNGLHFKAARPSKESIAKTAKGLSKTYSFYKDGQPITITNMKAYARDNGYSAGGIHGVVSGRWAYYKGFTLTAEHVKGEWKNHEWKEYNMLLNDNPVTITNLVKYCKDNSLTIDCMFDVLAGRSKSHKGYTLPA